MRLRTVLAATASAIAVVFSSLALAGPASSATAPVIVSPAEGGTLPVGSTGPLVIDFPAAGEYTISVSCDTYGKGRYSWWNGYSPVSYPAGRQSIAIDPLRGGLEELAGSTCVITVSGGSPFERATSRFAVTGSSKPVVVSPAPGGTIVRGSTGPLIIDFPFASGYGITVTCGRVESGAWYSWRADSQPYPAGRQSIPIDPLIDSSRDLAGKTCNIEVTGSAYSYSDPYISTFTVAAPALDVGDVHVSKKTFYPLVRDKYLDEVGFTFSVNRTADATLTVKNGNGKTVYEAFERLSKGLGRYEMPWNGNTTSGKPVKPGKYEATVATTADGITRTRGATVRVATKKATRKITVRKDSLDGWDSTRGKCFTKSDVRSESTNLYCWGGKYAAQTFHFKVPANAKILRWGLNYVHSSSDTCCRGDVTRRAQRVGKTKFTIRIQVSGWRAIEVRGARLIYRARVQI